MSDATHRFCDRCGVDVSQRLKDKLNEETPIVERLKQAMKLASNHWLVVNQDEQFRSAIGAVLLTANDEEQSIINGEMAFLRTLSAAHRGIPVDLGMVMDKIDPEKAYGILALWKEVKKENDTK